MHSKTAKLAAAAAIVIAVLLGLQFFGTSNVTFAQAIQPILNANTAILDIIIGVEDPNTPVIRDMIMGSRIRRTVPGVEENVSIIDLRTSRILSLTKSKKEAVYIDLKGLPRFPNYLDNLKNVFVELQDSPHFEIQDLGTKQIDGRDGRRIPREAPQGRDHPLGRRQDGSARPHRAEGRPVARHRQEPPVRRADGRRAVQHGGA